MNRPHGSTNSPRNKKVACTISAAALMLGVSSAATIGLHFQDNYCGSAAYSGYPVTLTAFGIQSNGWENLLPMNSGYSSCYGPLGYNLSEVINTTTSTDGLNRLPNGSLSVSWFGPTANFSVFAGYAGIPPNYYSQGGPLSSPLTGEEEVYATFLRDGINFGPPGGPNNDQPGYSIDITGLKSLFTNSSFVVELMASADSMETLTNAFVIDVTDSITNSVSYPGTPPVVNSEGTQYYQGPGGGLSTVSGVLNSDHIQIMSTQPQHVAGEFNHAGTISGFIITDKPVVTMSPRSIPLAGPGDTILLNPYAIGVPPLSYQWQFNGQAIAGATNSCYAITDFNLAAAGSYDLIVTNLYGATTSKVSTVTADLINRSPTNGIVYDSNPANTQNDGVNIGASWEASGPDADSVTRTGVMNFVATHADGITVADNASFNGPTGTITFWMRSAGTDDFGTGGLGASLFCRPVGDNSANDFILALEDSGGYLGFIAPGFANAFSSANGVSDNLWHYVALTFDQTASGGAALYIDGFLETTNANAASWTWPAGKPLEIGYSTDTYWGDYNGLLDDVRYYSVILSSTEIATIYRCDALVDTNDLQLQLNFTAAPGQGIVLAWKESSAVLQSAPAITGPWVDVAGSGSPYTIVPAATQQYFRYRYVPQSLVSNPYMM